MTRLQTEESRHELPRQSMTRAAFLRRTLGIALIAGGSSLLSACGQTAPSPAPTTASSGASAPAPTTPPTTVAQTTAPSPTTAPAPAAATAPAKSNVTLNFLNVILNDDETTKANDVISAFTTASGISVKMDMTPYPQFQDKVPTLLSSGSPPDVFYSDPANFPEFVKKNWLAPLDDLVASGKVLKRSDIAESYWQKGIYNGKIYGIPEDWSARGGYYNKEIFQRLKIDKLPETVADMKAAALQVTKADPQTFGYMWPMKDPDSWLNEGLAYIMLANGGSVVSEDATKCTFNSPELEETMSFFVDIWKAKATPQQGIDATNQDLYPVFGSGKVAMMHTGFFVIKAVLPKMAINGQYGTFAVKGMHGQYGTMVSVSTHSVPTQSKNHSEAYDLIQWIMKPENVAAFTTNPSVHAADSPENKSRFGDPLYKPFFDAAEQGGKWAIQPNPNLTDQMRIVHQESQNMILGRKTIKQGLADAAAAIQKTLGG